MRLRVELEQGLPVPSYYEPPDRIVVDVDHWAGLEATERLELLARECAHYVLLAVYPGRPRGLEAGNAGRQEERGRRLALHALVSDRDVLAAAVAGISAPHELAERWGRSPRWCAARVALWRVQHPALAELVGSV